MVLATEVGGRAECACSPWLQRGRILPLVALLMAAHFLSGQARSSAPNGSLKTETQTKVRVLNEEFARIWASTPVEGKLRAACDVDCAAVRDPLTGTTVSDELSAIQASKMAAADKVVSQIQQAIATYIQGAVRVTSTSLDRAAVRTDLRQILSGISMQPPCAFVLDSGGRRSLILFYSIQKGLAAGPESTSAILSAYNATASGLRLSDVTASDMDAYGRLSVQRLNAPAPNGIRLLVSGEALGANGPNTRMRIYRYEGKKFTTVWMPANVWGSFTTRVTRDGFRVDGPYYRSQKQRHDLYSVTPDGLYLSMPYTD